MNHDEVRIISESLREAGCELELREYGNTENPYITFTVKYRGHTVLSESPYGYPTRTRENAVEKMLVAVSARGFTLHVFTPWETIVGEVRFPEFRTTKELVMKLQLGAKITVEDFQS